jgi:hypothetical protein
MQMITTIEGDLPLSLLAVKDIVFLDSNSRTIATEYWHGETLVRRDVAISLLQAKVTETQGAL